MKLRIERRLEEIIPPLDRLDFEALKRSIREKGLIVPIHVMADGTIIDGHHRYKACKELKINPAYAVLENIKTIEDALEYSFEINFTRRQLCPARQAEWAIQVLRAKQQLHKQGGDQSKFSREKTLEIPQPTIESLADKVGLSDTTIARCIKIFDPETPDIIKDKVRKAEVSIKQVYEFMTSLDKFPAKKKEPFLEEFKEGRISDKISGIAETSQAAEDMLNAENKLVQATVRPKFEDKMWTQAFDIKQLQKLEHDILIAKGGHPKLETRFIEVSAFSQATEDEAIALAKKLGGRYLGKVTKQFYEVEIDPLKE